MDILETKLRNDWWPDMSAIDDYLAARMEAERLKARIKQYRERLVTFVNVLHGEPKNVLVSIPADWMPREDILRMIGEANTAWDKMHRAWAQLPTDQQKHVTPPIQDLE